MTIWIYLALSVIINDFFTFSHFTSFNVIPRFFIFVFLTFSITLDIAVLYEYFKQKK